MDYFKNISYLISHIFLLLFIYLFVTHRYSAKKTIGICCFTFFVLTMTDYLKFNLFPGNDLGYFIITILQILVTQFTGIFISQTRDGRALFMGLTSSNYVITGSIATAVLHIYTGNMFLSLAGGTAIHLAILLFLYFKIRDIWLDCYEGESFKVWWELCLIPVFFYCGFSFLVIFPNSIYDYPPNSLGVCMFMITMFVSYVVVFRYVESEANRIGFYWKNVLFETYIKGLENQYYLVEQSEKNLKILRHDMRHYSNMIDYLLEQEEYEEIKKITAYINKVTDENKVVKYCENIVMHSILSQMMLKAAALDVNVILDVDIPKEIRVSDYELGAAVGNLLENALIYVKDYKEKEKRYVRMKVHCTQEHILIQTENECDEDVAFDLSTGLPRSGKGKSHGLGMQSVSAFSDKIGGNVGCYSENGIFKVIVFAKF